jgi:hypothetical protein
MRDVDLVRRDVEITPEPGPIGSAPAKRVVSRLSQSLLRAFGNTRFFGSLLATLGLADGHAAPRRNANARRAEDAEEATDHRGSAGSRTAGPPAEISELSPEQLSRLWFIGRP